MCPLEPLPAVGNFCPLRADWICLGVLNSCIPLALLLTFGNENFGFGKCELSYSFAQLSQITLHFVVCHSSKVTFEFSLKCLYLGTEEIGGVAWPLVEDPV